MGKYETLAKDIVKNVGGKENVASIDNCITRLRFTLKSWACLFRCHAFPGRIRKNLNSGSAKSRRKTGMYPD